MGKYVNRYQITDTDYYVANGPSFLHDRYKTYAELDQFMFKASDDFRAQLKHEIPYPADMFWCSRFRWLKDYYAQHGKLPTSSSESEHAQSLARFVINMRGSNVITDEQKSLLDSITTDWRLKKNDIWESSLNKAAAFYRKHDRLPVHSKTDKNEMVLRSWIEGNKRVNLSPERKARLDQMLPGWNETEQDRWYATFTKVADFCAAHGKSPLKSSKSKEERVLGEWLSSVRQSFKKTDKLDTDQIAALEARIPGWSAGFGERWEDTLKEVVSFIAANNRWPEDGDRGASCSLGIWLRRQRETLMNNISPENQDRVDALNQNIPGWDETLDQRWERKLNSLVAYVNVHYKFPSDSDKKDRVVKDLGSWYQVQKRELNSGNLREDRKIALDNAIPHWKDSWEYKLYKAAATSKVLGKIPSTKDKDKGNASTGLWVARQRRDRAKLTTEQIDALNTVLPMWDAV